MLYLNLSHTLKNKYHIFGKKEIIYYVLRKEQKDLSFSGNYLSAAFRLSSLGKISSLSVKSINKDKSAFANILIGLVPPDGFEPPTP